MVTCNFGTKTINVVSSGTTSTSSGGLYVVTGSTFQSLIDSMEEHGDGCTYVIGSGMALDSEYTISKNNCTVMRYGSIEFYPGNGARINITGSNNVLKGLVFYAPNFPATGTMFKITGIGNKMQSCYIWHGSGVGIECNGDSGTHLWNPVLFGTNYLGTGLKVTGGSTNGIVEGIGYISAFATNKYGIWTDNSSYWTVKTLSSDHSCYGMYFAPSGNNLVHHWTFIEANFDYAPNGGSCVASGGSSSSYRMNNLNFYNSWMYAHTDSGPCFLFNHPVDTIKIRGGMIFNNRSPPSYPIVFNKGYTGYSLEYAVVISG